MKLNLDVFLSCGAFLLWLGVALGIAGVVLFVASGGAVGFSTTTSHVTNLDGSVQVSKSIACGSIHIGTLQRLAFLLPVIAGGLLAISGYSIRNTIQNLKVEHVVVGSGG